MKFFKSSLLMASTALSAALLSALPGFAQETSLTFIGEAAEHGGISSRWDSGRNFVKIGPPDLINFAVPDGFHNGNQWWLGGGGYVTVRPTDFANGTTILNFAGSAAISGRDFFTYNDAPNSFVALDVNFRDGAADPRFASGSNAAGQPFYSGVNYVDGNSIKIARDLLVDSNNTVVFNNNGGVNFLVGQGHTIRALDGAVITFNGSGLSDFYTGDGYLDLDPNRVVVKSGGGTVIAGDSNFYGRLDIAEGKYVSGGGHFYGSVTGTGELELNPAKATVGHGDDHLWQNGNNVFQRGSGLQVVDARVTGSGSLYKDGDGTLRLTNNQNSYTGGTFIRAGRIEINDEYQTGGYQNQITFSGGALVATDSFLINRRMTVTAGTTGAFEIGSGLTVQQYHHVDIGTNGLFIKDGGGSLILSGPVTGAGSLVVKDGTLTATTSNSYSGGTFLEGGRFEIGSGENLGGYQNQVTFRGGTLAAGLSFGMNNRINVDADKTGTFVVEGQHDVTQFNVTDVGAGGSFIKDGTGTLHLAGDVTGAGSVTVRQGTLTLDRGNTYSGGTYLNGGTALVGSDVNLGASEGGLYFDGGTLAAWSSFSTNRSTVLNSGGGTFNLVNASVDQHGDITGNGALTVTGNSTLFLWGHNDYSGDTVIGQDSGIWTYGGQGIGDASRVVMQTNSRLFVRGQETIGSLEGTGNVLLDADIFTGATGNLITGGNNRSTTYSGAITGDGNLTKVGAGTMTLSGANTFQGTVSLNGGAVQISADANLGNASNALSFDGGTLTATAGTPSTFVFVDMTRNTTLNTAGGTFNLVSAIVDQRGDITGTGSLNVTGQGGLLRLWGHNDYSGDTTIGQGTAVTALGGQAIGDASRVVTQTDSGLIVQGTETIGSLEGNGFLVLNQDVFAGSTGELITGGNNRSTTYSGPISGNGNLTKVGAGTMILSGANTFQGTVSLNGGTVQISADANLGNASNALSFDGGTLATAATFTMNRTAVLNQGGGTFDVAVGTALTEAGNIGGSGSLRKDNSGTLILTGTNTYAGATTINAGTLTLSGAISIGSSLVNVGGNGSLVVSNGSLLVTPTINVDVGGTFRLEGGAVVSQNITNNGSLNYSGGNLVATDRLTNASGAELEISGGGIRIINSNVVNNGTIKTTDTHAVFTGTFTNNGAFISDPSTNSFSNLIIGADGYLKGGAGDEFVISGDFINESIRMDAWDTRAAKLTFSGGVTHVVDFGNGSQFAWGTLSLQAGAGLDFGNSGSNLYIGWFDLADGLAQLGQLSGNFAIFYDAGLAGNAYLNGGSYDLGGGGRLIAAFSSAPAPGALMLLALGLFGFGAIRRRRLN